MNRELLTKTFDEYTSNYNLADPKIRLKYEHTYRVAELSEQIARSIEGLSEHDIDIAWQIGMLHDIGRFEQVRRFGTFIEADSVNHAEFGADLLFGSKDGNLLGAENHIEIEVEEPELVEIAIRNHNRYRIDEGLAERETIFCNIIRDADKIDILRVNLDYNFEEIYNVSMEELCNSEISDKAMTALLEGHAVKRDYKMTAMDKVVAHASMMQELVFPLSRKILKEERYLNSLLDKPSHVEETIKRLEITREHLRKQGLMY